MPRGTGLNHRTFTVALCNGSTRQALLTGIIHGFLPASRGRRTLNFMRQAHTTAALAQQSRLSVPSFNACSLSKTFKTVYYTS